MAHPPENTVRIRRFYTAVGVSTAEGASTILLDGRVARTPAGRALALPTPALADLVRSEWEAQGTEIALSSMPATRLAHTALDGVPERRAETVHEFARFAETDLICYFAESPGSLVRREEEAWGPLLIWARDELGLTFTRAKGITHRLQPPEVLAGVTAIGEAADAFALAALAFGAAAFGSAILVLALRAGRIDADQAFTASQVDETFQAEHWGVDDEAAMHAARLRRDAAMLENWFRALG